MTRLVVCGASTVGAILILTVLTAVSALAAGTAPQTELERAVLVQRHGVRAPTKSSEAYQKFSAENWPEWPVGVAALTPHGAANVRFLAAWLRAHYAAEGLLPATGCPAESVVAVWADGGTQRTLATGQSILDGAFLPCGLVARHGPEGKVDPIFNAVEAGLCPIDPLAAHEALSAAAGDLKPERPGLAAARAALYSILTASGDPGSCHDDQGACFLFGASAIRDGKHGPTINGPLATASTLVENLLLEYEQGMPMDQVGWGRADAAELAKVGPLHNYYAALVRRTPYLAAHNGGLLARTVLAALKGRAAVDGMSGKTKLLVIAGHDTNLSNLAGILGLDWTLPGQPDNTPPGGTLAFELRRDRAGAEFVQIVLYYLTLDQLRAASPLNKDNPPGRIALPLPGCSDGPAGSCPVERFLRRVDAAIPPECVLPPKP